MRTTLGNKQQIYGLTNDVVFKYVFGSPEKEKLSVCLINALLGLEGQDQIVGVTFLNPFSTKEYPNDRGSVVDVRVTDASERRYFIEVQVAHQCFFAHRAVYYAAKTFVDQLKAGQGFETLKKTTGISILDFTLFSDDPRLHSIYRLRDLESGRELAETLELHFVELDKFDLTKPRRRMSRFEKWMYLFRKAPVFVGGEEPLPAEFSGVEELNMTIEKLKKVNADAEMRQIIEGQERWEHDVASRLYDATQAGLAKGRTEGADEKALAIAASMINEGLDMKLIAKLTGLPEPRLGELMKSQGKA